MLSCDNLSKVKKREIMKKSIILKSMSIVTITLSSFFVSTVSAQGLNFSFQGTFEADDDVKLFKFTVGATSTVTLKTLSYAGGTQADGTIISAGGFDPVLSLFDGGGNFMKNNDDGSFNVNRDLITGQTYDAFLQETLSPGKYTVAITQFYNFFDGEVGDNISLGFRQSGDPNFTYAFCDNGSGPFCDISGDIRNNQWAFDILNVNQRSQQEVPEPLTILGSLTALGFGGLFRKKLSFQSQSIIRN